MSGRNGIGWWKTESGHVLPYIEAGGQPRLLAALTRDPKLSRRFARFGASVPTVPFGADSFDRFGSLDYPIKDQNGKGACMGHAACSALEISYRLAFGSLRPLSAWFCYSCINGGVDAGALVSDALASIQRDGSCPDEMVPYKTHEIRRISADAREAAKLYRAESVYEIHSEEELYTAVLFGHPVAFGCLVDQRFLEVDGDGIPGQGGGSAGGHAMCAWGGYRIDRRGRRLYRVINSWNTSWGVGGCCWMPFGMISRGGLDAFAVVHTVPTPVADDSGPVAPPVPRRLTA